MENCNKSCALCDFVDRIVNENGIDKIRCSRHKIRRWSKTVRVIDMKPARENDCYESWVYQSRERAKSNV